MVPPSAAPSAVSPPSVPRGQVLAAPPVSGGRHRSGYQVLMVAANRDHSPTQTNLTIAVNGERTVP
jgi:hypothetical protein